MANTDINNDWGYLSPNSIKSFCGFGEDRGGKDFSEKFQAYKIRIENELRTELEQFQEQEFEVNQEVPPKNRN